MSRVKHLLQRLARRRQVEEELDAEVHAYFEILIERGMTRGLSREEAQRAARLQFGGAEQVKARVRDARAGSAIDTTLQDEVVSRSTSRQRMSTWLMALFGVSASLLAAIGIYGLLSYSVQQRTQEIGIRLALGAPISHVKNMVIVQGMRLAVAGVAIGVAAAFGVTRFMASFLLGVEAWDPTVFVLAPLLLSVVAFLAAWIPARRASCVDPVVALRAE